MLDSFISSELFSLEVLKNSSLIDPVLLQPGGNESSRGRPALFLAVDSYWTHFLPPLPTPPQHPTPTLIPLSYLQLLQTHLSVQFLFQAQSSCQRTWSSHVNDTKLIHDVQYISSNSIQRHRHDIAFRISGSNFGNDKT